MVAKAISIVAVLSMSACIVGDAALEREEDIEIDTGDLQCAEDEIMFVDEDGSASCGTEDDIDPSPDFFGCYTGQVWYRSLNYWGNGGTRCVRRRGVQYCGTVLYSHRYRNQRGWDIFVYIAARGTMCTS